MNFNFFGQEKPPVVEVELSWDELNIKIGESRERMRILTTRISDLQIQEKSGVDVEVDLQQAIANLEQERDVLEGLLERID